MAMAHGKGGSVTLTVGGDVTNVTSWSVNMTADMAETTFMAADAAYKSYLAGFKDWTATIEVNVCTAALTVLGSTLTACTLTDGSATFTAATNGCICTGISVACDAQGITKATMSIQGILAPTSWTAA